MTNDKRFFFFFSQKYRVPKEKRKKIEKEEEFEQSKPKAVVDNINKTEDSTKAQSKDDEARKKSILSEYLKGNPELNGFKTRERKVKQRSFADVKFNEVLKHLTPDNSATATAASSK